MRLHYMYMYSALVVAASLLATTDAVSAATTSKQTSRVEDTAVDTTSYKLLKVDPKSETDDDSVETSKDEEERALTGAKAEAAKKLKAIMQLDDWFSANKKPEEVFKILGLERIGKKVFTTKEFEVYKNYIRYYNKHQPLLVPKLSVEESKNSAQFRAWFQANMKPRQVFKELGLVGKGKTVREMDEFKTYINYVRYYNKNQPLIMPS